jgi:hypothetical protein
VHSQQMHELRPFAVPDHHKVLQNRFSAWCEVGACRAGCCALSLVLGLARAQPCGNGQGGQHPSEPAQAPRQGHRTGSKPNPLVKIVIEVCSDAKGGSLFQSGCQGIQAVVVDHVTGASREVQGTNKHATLLPSRQHIKEPSIKL